MMDNSYEDSSESNASKSHFHHQHPQIINPFPADLVQLLKPSGVQFSGLEEGSSGFDHLASTSPSFGIPFQGAITENNDHDDLLHFDGSLDENVDVSGAMVTFNSNCPIYDRVIYPDCIDTTRPTTEEITANDGVSQQHIEMVEVSAKDIKSIPLQNPQTDVPLSNLKQDECTSSHSCSCNFCSRRFRKKSTLMDDIVAHQDNRLIQCKLCGSYFQSRVDLMDHLNDHADDNLYLNTLKMSQSPYNRKIIILHETDDEIKNEEDDSEGCEKKVTAEAIKSENRECSLDTSSGNSYLTYSISSLNSMSNTTSNCVSPFLLSDSEQQQEQFCPLNQNEVLEDVLDDDNSIESKNDCISKESNISLIRKITDETKRDGNFVCSQCASCFTCQNDLLTHMKTHCSDNMAYCTQCSSHFENEMELNKHKLFCTGFPLVEKHIQAKTLKCVLCGRAFALEKDIQNHINLEHKEQMTEHTCLVCGKDCRNRRKLIKHTWEHSRKNFCICMKCGKEFCNITRLKRHMTSHRDKTVHCNVCGKGFPDGRSLSNHRHAHSTTSGGKLFSCDKCGKKFGSRSSQQIHYRTHTGEKPYSCSFCWKAFADGGTLRKHERIHTGEKPYECIVCQKAFNQRVVLREHIRSHHSDTNKKDTVYCCVVCDEKFQSSKELIEHLIKHCDHNTALKRKPVTGPRKYKRRRKLSAIESNFDNSEVNIDANNSEDCLNEHDDERAVDKNKNKNTQKDIKRKGRKKATKKRGRPPKKKNKNSKVERYQPKSEEDKSMKVRKKNILKEVIKMDKQKTVSLRKRKKLVKEMTKLNNELNILSDGQIAKEEPHKDDKAPSVQKSNVENKKEKDNKVSQLSVKRETFLNDKESKEFVNANWLIQRHCSDSLQNLENSEISNENRFDAENRVVEISDIYDSSLFLELGGSLRNEIDDLFNSPVKAAKTNMQYRNNINLEQHLIQIEPTSPDLNEIMNGVQFANTAIASPSNSYSALSSAIISEQQRGGHSEKLPKTTSLDLPDKRRNNTTANDRTIFPTWKEEFTNDKVNLATSTTSNFHKVSSQDERNDGNNNVGQNHYEQETKSSLTYFCEMCSLKFTDRAQLLAHVPMHI